MQRRATLCTFKQPPAHRASQSESSFFRLAAEGTCHPNKALQMNKMPIFTPHVRTLFSFFAWFKANRTAVFSTVPELTLGHKAALRCGQRPPLINVELKYIFKILPHQNMQSILTPLKYYSIINSESASPLRKSNNAFHARIRGRTRVGIGNYFRHQVIVAC